MKDIVVFTIPFTNKLKQMRYTLVLLVIFAGTLHSVTAQNERRFIRNGTDHYENEEYVESEVEFRKALEKEPNSFEARFNLGDALFKQEKVDEAIQQFQSLTNNTEDKERLSDIYHNIGNGFFAKKELEKSIEAYKEALRHDPDDDETRYNLIAAQKLRDKQKKQEQQKKQQQQEQQQQKQKQQKQQQEQKQQQQQEQQQEQQQKQLQQGMSKEDAERILRSIDENEKEIQERIRKAKEKQQQEIKKNW